MNIGAAQQPPTIPASRPLSISYSITQHYHHSSHLASHAPAAVEHRPEPALAINEILKSHNIDTAWLTPSQLTLFEHAGEEQRSRLVQIWQICLQGSSISGPMNAEEKDSQCCNREITEPKMGEGLVESIEPPIPPEDLEMNDSQLEGNRDDAQQYAEPYMASGYEAMNSHSEYGFSGTNAFTKFGTMLLPTEPTTGFPYRVSTGPALHS